MNRVDLRIDPHLSLRDRIFHRLRMAILEGEFAPGERVTEMELADRIGGVSRTPIREALFQLAQEGLVELQGRRQTIIRGISLEDAIQINTIRTQLEPLAARLAVPHLTTADFDEMRRSIEVTRDYTTLLNLELLLQAHGHFHGLFVDRSGSRWLTTLLNNLTDYVVRFRRSILSRPEYVSVSLEEHTEIYQAALRRDADEVERLTRDHISHIESYLRQVLL